jgi:hypothetical protein
VAMDIHMSTSTFDVKVTPAGQASTIIATGYPKILLTVDSSFFFSFSWCFGNCLIFFLYLLYFITILVDETKI